MEVFTIKRWLISRKWLWKKVVFDNGICGENYYRYDHYIFKYSQGMGNNGEHGGIRTAIKRQLESGERQLIKFNGTNNK